MPERTTKRPHSAPKARPARARESYYFIPIAEAERRLWAAIVTDAVEICLGRTLVPAEERHAARRWIEAGGMEVGGFLWCCHLLGLDDDAITDRLATVRPKPSAMESRRRLILGYARPRGPVHASDRARQDLARSPRR